MLLHLFIFYHLIIWKPCISFYPDGTRHVRNKITKLAEELVKDAVSKIESVQHLRTTHYKSIQFQYGSLLYEINYRLAKMFKIYEEVVKHMEDNPTQGGSGVLYVDAIAEVDILAHDIQNLQKMILLHDAKLHADKTKPGYDLFFRRNEQNMAPVWLELADTLDNYDNKNPFEPSTPPPEENNQTHNGKKKNGEWHYAVPNV